MEPAEELRYLILGAQREGNRLLADALRPLGLTPSQAEVLRVLTDHGPMALLDLGRLLVCESGSPSRLVDGLVKAGLVGRVEATDDRRKVVLTLTRSGRRAAADVAVVEADLHGLIAAVVPPKALTAAITALRGLVDGRPAGEALTRRRRPAGVSGRRG
jgi:DNA-binding MarR family transcriptional regulator